MLKLNKLCKVCDEVKENTSLLNRIYNSKYYLKSSKESLLQIQEEYADVFSYRSLLNHVKKHQFMSEGDFKDRHLRKIAKDAEKKILKRQIESKEVWDEVINQGMEKLQSGELTMRTADLLKAAKDKSDHEMKVKDQQLAMAEMMWFFASGENNESRSYDRRIIEGKAVTDFDPTEESTGNTNSGENGPSNLHNTVTWDALASGSDTLSQGNDTEKK